MNDAFRARTTFSTPLGPRTIFRLDALRDSTDLDRLPYIIRILLEAALRRHDGRAITDEDVTRIASYDPAKLDDNEIRFMPGRVVLQDFTGIPVMVDMAAMRDAIVRLTGNPNSAAKVNPRVPCDLVIDHSVQVDAFGSSAAFAINASKDFSRNQERYTFLKWGQSAFANFRVVPPATGIVHQVNLEYLAKVVWDDGTQLYPDTVIGTDSHTTMINGLGVLAWGVGGIEAEAVMLGEPVSMLLPEVVGFHMKGRLPEGSTATDAVLRVTQMLRSHGVVGKFVEFVGPGLDEMPLATRATISNMCPEYGATAAYFPVDDHTLAYLELTGRHPNHIQTVAQYCREQGLWRENGSQIVYATTLELDLSSVTPALAGPSRPQDRIDLSRMQPQFQEDLRQRFGKQQVGANTEVEWQGNRFGITDGSVVIAAITSCTNTSNPEVMVGAGLLARKARERGLTSRPWVKTSLAPGSPVVTEYLAHAGLLDDLEALGFYLVGYGCTTCIGNSGPLPEPISQAITQNNLVAAAVLSGNRNFEGRISPDCRANYLASPPLVVAYALAGTVDFDMASQPLGTDRDGNPVYLREIWPSQAEIEAVIRKSVKREQFSTQYAHIYDGDEHWQAIPATTGSRYDWKPASTYLQEPPYLLGLSPELTPLVSIKGARVLVWLGDSVTTDHISPAGSIKEDSPAGRYLISQGVPQDMFNSYGSRRGNDRVMTRGTFANPRIRNLMLAGTEGGVTRSPSGEVTSIYEAAMEFRQAGTPLVVLAGKDYGMGSSRDWAAKGTSLLGVKAVIAESFERIHRSNLIGMGVLPLTFLPGESATSLGLVGTESYSIGMADALEPRQLVGVRAERTDGTHLIFTTSCRIDTPLEMEYYRNGGILPAVVRKLARSGD